MTDEAQVRLMSRAELRSIISSAPPDELRALAAEIGPEQLKRILLPPSVPSEAQCEKLAAAIAVTTDEGWLRKLRETVSEWDFASREGADAAVGRRIADLAARIDCRLAALRPLSPPPRCLPSTEPAPGWASPSVEPPSRPASGNVVDVGQRRPQTAGDNGPAPKMPRGDGWDFLR